MTHFVFSLGEVVILDPTGKGLGPHGQVIGRIEYLDGAIGYVVSVCDLAHGEIRRHHLSESEIMATETKP